MGLLALCGVVAGAAANQDEQSTTKPVDLTSMSMEDLMKIQVTSASKKSESLSAAPAAIFVITAEDIRRGEFSSVPEALRTVPGLYVAQLNSHVWLVTARGFSNVYNDKMLVLIDGRSVYSPTFGGVFWDVQDPPLEDIDRIEVIRGPAGTLWGADAMNGVINIITKTAENTQSLQVVGSAGVNEGYAGRVRYGGKIGDGFAYRIYGTSNDWLPSVDAAGRPNYDEWSITQGGTRVDWTLSQKDILTIDGQGYSGRIRDVVPIFTPTSAESKQEDSSGVIKGGHVLGRWKHAFNDWSDTDLLAYCDWTDRISLSITEFRNTCDVEFQHRYAFTPRHTITWGGSIFTTGDFGKPTFSLSLFPPYSRDTTYSAFLQYDVMLVPDKFRLIAGSKFEHNPYTGFEYQPQIRLVWTPDRQNSIWAAVSRAVRTPNLIDEGIRDRIEQVNPFPPPSEFLLYSGDTDVKSEILHAFEAGYRYEWKEKFSLDATAYYNDYDGLEGLTAPQAPIVNPSPLFIDLPVLTVNELQGAQTHGLELFVKYTPMHRWTLTAGVTELRGTSPPGTGLPAVDDNPRHEATIQSKLDFSRFVSLDASYFYNDTVSGQLPPLNRLDVGFSIRPVHGFTFSAWGKNLQQQRHLEAIPEENLGGEIRRSVTFKVIWEPGEDAKKTTP
jgi:iron complex outermembrane receptor protein